VLLRNIVKPIFDDHHCKLQNFSADNAFAFFDTVDDAIISARELHTEVYESRLMLTEDEPFQVCIGIGYGDMLYSETLEGYFSDEMNFASKLGEDLARCNETRITVNAYDHAQPRLVRDFTPQQVDISGVSIEHYLHVFKPQRLPGR
jgi:class 3 adenylate cyclase